MGKTFKDSREFKDALNKFNDKVKVKKKLTRVEKLEKQRLRQDALMDKFARDGLS